jgi:mycofactocin precursor
MGEQAVVETAAAAGADAVGAAADANQPVDEVLGGEGLVGDELLGGEGLVGDELLVEEVSIDGMCGVY